MSGVRPDLFARLHDDLESGFREDLEEAVVDPARWPDLAERVVRASGSEGALLLRSDRTGLESLCTASLADASRRYFDEGWHRDDHRLRGIPLMRTRGIAVDQDFTTPEEIARLPFYQDLLASRGLRWFAGIGFAVKGRLWCLSLQRTVEQGPYEPHEQRRLATLSPLLQRAGLLTSMVERARLAGLTQAFELIDRAGITPRDLLREKGTPYAELSLSDTSLSDEALVDAMMAHPILINRPLVVSPLGVKLCRPSEAVLDLLPSGQLAAFAKEDGEQVVDASGQRVA